MSDTTFLAHATPIRATWLNDVNRVTYREKISAMGYATLQEALVHAATLTDVDGPTIEVDGCGQTYELDTTLDMRAMPNVLLKNAKLLAFGDSWSAADPIIKIGKISGAVIHGTSLERLQIDCAHKCAGIYIADTNGGLVRDVHVFRFETFGLRTGGARTTELLLDHVKLNQYEWDETGFDLVANRTAYGFDIATADVQILFPIAYVCYCPMRYTGGYGQVIAPHFYNGASDGVDELILLCDNSPNTKFVGGYWDNGVVRIRGNFNVSLVGGEFQKSALIGNNTMFLDLVATAASEHADGLLVTGNRLTAGATTFVTFSTEGSGSWVVEDQLRCDISSNVRTGSGLDACYGRTGMSHVILNDGTLDHPALRFGDEATGLYQNADEEVTLVLGGRAAVKFNAGGIAPGTDASYSWGTAALRWLDGFIKRHLYVSGSAGVNRGVRVQTNGLDRWALFGSAAAESGSNAGTNFALDRYDDAGGYLSTPIQAYRDTGNVALTLQASATPQANKELMFQLTDNTHLVVKVKGADGVVRDGPVWTLS